MIIKNAHKSLIDALKKVELQRKSYIEKYVVTIECPLHVFIDGNHLYKNSKDDLSAWLPHLKKLHSLAPDIDELAMPLTNNGEEEYYLRQNLSENFDQRNYWERPGNNFDFSEEKHLKYCKLFLDTSIKLIEEDINKNISENLIKQKKITSSVNVLDNKTFEGLTHKIFGGWYTLWPSGGMYLSLFDDLNYFFLTKESSFDKINNFKKFIQIAKLLPELKNLTFIGDEDQKIRQYYDYIFPSYFDEVAQKRLAKIINLWDPIEDLKYIKKLSKLEKIYRIKFSSSYKLYKGSLTSSRLINSLNYKEKVSTNLSTLKWIKENKKLIPTGKALWSEKDKYPSSITNIHDFYYKLKDSYVDESFTLKNRITKWDIVGKEGYYKLSPEEKAVDTALSNDVMAELYGGESNKIICIITNDTDFTSTLINIEEAEKNNSSNIKKTYMCSAFKKSRVPKELKSFDVNFVFPKDSIGHFELGGSLWKETLPDYSYLVDKNAKNNLKKNMEVSLEEFKKDLMKMEKEYRFKKESLDSLLEEIDKIYEELKDLRIN